MLRISLRYGILASGFILLSEILKNVWLYSGRFPELFIIFTALLFLIGGFILKSQWNVIIPSKLAQNNIQDNSYLQLLSKREQEVLEYLLGNSPNKEIADKLNIGNSTLKTHINVIYKKLNITCRRELHEKCKSIR